MKISNKLPQFTDTKALIIASAKEHGVAYIAHNGEMREVAAVEEHPPRYSDDEGFFFGSTSTGITVGGAPKEVEDEDLFRDYIKAIKNELNAIIKREKPDIIYVFEPSQLSGRLNEYLKNPSHIPVTVVRNGNYVKEHSLTLLRYIAEYESPAKEPIYAIAKQ